MRRSPDTRRNVPGVMTNFHLELATPAKSGSWRTTSLHSSTQLIKTALSSAQVSTHNSAQSIRRAGGAEITERRIGHLDSEVIGFHRAEVLRNDHIQHFPAVHCPEHTWLEILIIDHLEKRVLSIDRSAMPTPHTYQIMQSNHRPHRAARVWVF